MPLPSGVIIAEKSKKIKAAYRQLFLQKFFSTIPSQLNKFIKIGKRNIKPLTNIKLKTKTINSLATKKGVMPIATGKS